ncbi:hypothetical protein ACFQX7_19130 [Luedemannella flava]
MSNAVGLRGGDLATGSSDTLSASQVHELARALEESTPDWLVATSGLGCLQILGYIVVAVLLALPAANRYFRKPPMPWQPPVGSPPPPPPGGWPPANQPPGGWPPTDQPPGGWPPGNQPPPSAWPPVNPPPQTGWPPASPPQPGGWPEPPQDPRTPMG